MNKNIDDPRELLAEKLYKAGIDAQQAYFIAIDAGVGLVDKGYLKEIGLKGKQLKIAGNMVKDFYWEDNDSY